NPEGPATLLAVVRHLFIHELIAELRTPGGSEELEVKLAELNSHLAEAERVILAMNGVDRHQVLELARFLQLIDLETGHERSLAVLDRWLGDHPNDLNVRTLLAIEQQAIGHLDEAEALARSVVKSEPLPVSLASDRQHMDRLHAATILFGIIGDRRDEADSALLKRDAEEARDAVIELLGGDTENAVVLQMNGHLAYAAGQYSKAVDAFERAYRLSSDMPAELLRQDADALERIGQEGTAIKRLEGAVDAEPRSVGNRLLLAALHGRMRNPRAAMQVLESLPKEVREGNEQIAQVEQSLRLAMLGSDQRAEKAAAGTDPVMKAIAEADQLDRAGRLDEAKAVLSAIKADGHEDDVRVLIALGQVESRLGNREAALAFVQQAAAIQPNNRQIEKMAMGLSSDDPVEVLRAVVNQQYPEGEERAVAWFLGLQAIAISQDQLAEATIESNPDRSTEARKLAERARAEASPFADAVEAASSSNAQAFAYHFDQLLGSEQFGEAEALLPAARDNNWDQAQGNLAEASFLMARGRAAREAGGDGSQDFIRAAAAARRATDVSPWRGATWKSLGEAMSEVGNLEEARLAYVEVIQRDPSDVQSVRKLAALYLGEGGDAARAVAILADASRRHPSNRSLRETWLQIEAAHGDKAAALGERYLDWNRNPSDRQAALWYAGLMAVLPTERAYVLDDQGKPSLSGRDWLKMSGQQQEKAMTLLNDEWLRRIDQIADDLANTPDRTLREAMQHATVLREAGRREETIGVLHAWLEQQQDAQDLTEQAIQVARFLGASDRFWEAKALLDGYRDKQDATTMEVDAALGEMLHAIGSCDQALPYLVSVGETTGSLAMRMRAADCLLRLRRLDEAEDVIAALQIDYPDDYQMAMLVAGLHRGRGVVAESSGDVEESLKHRVAFRAALEHASELDPTRDSPFVQLVESLVIEYRRTLNRQHLEEAMRYLDAADRLSNSAELVMQRSDVQEALGDPRQAVLDLESYLRQNPQDKAVRTRLAQAFVTAGMSGRAIDTIEQAIGADPRNPYWHGLLGDHLRQAGTDLESATLHYIDAWKLEPTRRRLTALTDATRTDQAWDYEAAIHAIEENAEHVAADPRIVGLRARAEAGLGLSTRARESLREAYSVYGAAVASGEIPDVFLENWYEDLYVLFPDGDSAEAVKLRNEIVGDSPTRWDRRGLARFFALRGGSEMSTAESIQASVVADNDAEHFLDDLHRLGAYQLAASMNTEAAATFKQILEHQPNDAISLNNYAFLLATLLNDPEAAEPLARRAVALRPREPSFIDT
ncbi:MAG: tetratricopeptide repeat protein, partial [Phycisphaerae bacterium]|nr:tetratricopeptide repeat protein [Phycisphaerae bacterium]